VTETEQRDGNSREGTGDKGKYRDEGTGGRRHVRDCREVTAYSIQHTMDSQHDDRERENVFSLTWLMGDASPMGCANSCSASIIRSKVTRFTMVSRRYLTFRTRREERRGLGGR
jgi:hypothetical protein